MKIAIDTYYKSDTEAYTVGVIFDKWTDKEPTKIISCTTTEFGPYIPGEFYKRELPCIIDLLNLVELNKIDTIILDSYIRLENNKPGLGIYLSKEIPETIELIGVAKTEFHNAPSYHLIRGKCGTTRPLYIQALHMTDEQAGNIIKMMYGDFRIPNLLKILDKETKSH